MIKTRGLSVFLGDFKTIFLFLLFSDVFRYIVQSFTRYKFDILYRGKKIEKTQARLFFFPILPRAVSQKKSS